MTRNSEIDEFMKKNGDSSPQVQASQGLSQRYSLWNHL